MQGQKGNMNTCPGQGCHSGDKGVAMVIPFTLACMNMYTLLYTSSPVYTCKSTLALPLYTETTVLLLWSRRILNSVHLLMGRS